MSWKRCDRWDASLGRRQPLPVWGPLHRAGGEEVAGTRVVAVPVHVVGEVLALGLVLAFGGAGEEGGDPGEVRDQMVLHACAVVGLGAVGKLGRHWEPDPQDVEQDNGKEKTHFVVSLRGCLGLTSASMVSGIYAPSRGWDAARSIDSKRCACPGSNKLCGNFGTK